MEYANMIGKHGTDEGLRSFAQSLFSALCITDGEERESGNYVDGHYFRGSRDNLTFTISLSDESGHEDLPYWIHVAGNVIGTDILDMTIDKMVRRELLPSGFRLDRVINFGKRDEQRIAY